MRIGVQLQPQHFTEYQQLRDAVEGELYSGDEALMGREVLGATIATRWFSRSRGLNGRVQSQ